MGKKLRDEDLVLNIIVNGDQGKKEINELERSIVDSRVEISKLLDAQKKLEKQGKADSAQYVANKAAIDKYTAGIKTAEERIALLRKGMKLEEMSITDLSKKLSQLTRLRNASVPGTAQWNKYSQEIQQVATRLATLKKKSVDTGASICKVADGVNKYIGLISAGGLSFLSIISGANYARDAFAKYDDKLSDVMKTTGLTKEETEALAERLKRINTRTSQLELLDLARVAGKLGLSASEDIEGFVRAADKINVALSGDLGENAEEALNKVGKLVDIFDLKKKYGIEDSMIRVGSTINELGAASTANEGYIVEFTNRLAGIAPQAGISIENVMGLGATLDQFGQQCETAGTTASQAITGMFKKTAQYARIAGMGVSDFSMLLNRDANAAFIAFLHGLKNSEGGMSGMTRNLASLKLEGSRATQILGALATNVDTLEEQQRLANEAFAEGTSVINEFNTKNNNAQAQYEKSKKIIQNLAVEIGRSLTPAYYSVTNALANMASTGRQMLQDEIDRYKSSRTEVEQKKRSLDSLLTTYSELRQKATLTTGEQSLLNDSIRKIGEICPAAITETNNYGEAIEINIERLNRAIEAQERFNIITGKGVGLDIYKQLKENAKEIDSARTTMQKASDDMDAINSGKQSGRRWVVNPFAGASFWRESPEEIENRLKVDYKEAEKTAQNAKEKMRDLNADTKQCILSLSDIGEHVSDIAAASGVSVTEVIDLINATKKLGEEEKKITTNEPPLPPEDKSKSQWSLDKDKKFVAEKLALNQKFRDGEIATDEEYARQLLALEISTLESRIALNTDGEKHLSQLKSDLADRRFQQTKSEQSRYEKLLAAGSAAGGTQDTQRLMKQEKANLEKQLKDLELFNKNREDMTEVELKAVTNLERNYQDKIQSIYMDGIVRRFNDEKAALERKHNELKIAHNQELDSLTTLDDKKKRLSSILSAGELNKIKTDKQADAALNNFYEDEERKELQGHLQQMLSYYEAYLTEISEKGVTGVGKMNEEEQRQLQSKIDDLRSQLAGLRGQKTPGETTNSFEKVDILGFSKKDWDDFAAHMDAGKLTIDDWQMALQVVGQTFGQISQLMSAAENREFAQYEKTAKKKKKSLDTQLKSGKISQEQYASQVEQIDEETDRKKEELSRKQAGREKALGIFQAMTNTAVGITAALKMGPIMGPILAAMIGVLGAAQIAMIAATPLPGAEDGGWLDVKRQQDGKRFRAKSDPGRRGYVSDPRVIVAEAGTEYVVPNEGYENPTVRPVLDLIESARRNGTLRSINLPAVMSAYAVPGRYQGGYAGDSDRTSFNPAPNSDSYNNMPLDRETVQELIEGIRKFNRTCSRPLDVNNYAGGRRGISKALKDYNRIRSNAFM